MKEQDKIIQQMNKQKAWLEKCKLMIEENTATLSQVTLHVRRNMLVTQLLAYLGSIERSIDDWLLQKQLYQKQVHACVMGQNDNVIPYQILKQILDSELNQKKLQQEFYDQYISVVKVFEVNETVVCHLRVPLLAEEKYLLYYLKTFAVPREGIQGYARVYHDTVVAKGTWLGKFFLPINMKGRNPVVAEPGIIYHTDQMPCLNGIITDDPEQYKMCPIQLTKVKDKMRANRVGHDNKFIVDTVELPQNINVKVSDHK